MKKNNLEDLEKAKDLLIKNDDTLVLVRDTLILEIKERGIKPLLDKVCDGNSYEEFSVADKVIGKGASFLYVLLKIKSVYAMTISKSALEVLNKNGVFITYDNLVENIVNRKKDGICPIEECVLKENNPFIAYNLIKEKLKTLK